MTQKVAVVLLAVAAALGFAVPAAAGPVAQPSVDDLTTQPAPAAQADANNTSNASLGASVSAFMQASAADTEGEVADGMFAASFNRSEGDRRAQLVTNRTQELQNHLERLREQRRALLDREGNLTVAERAKAARLAAQIDALEESIGRTERAAERAGVDTARLQELRNEARTLAGPEVARMATDIAGGGPPADRGPPVETGPNVTDGQGPDGNATGAGPGNGSGAGNGTDAGSGGNGPPDDGGGQGNGPPDDAGDGAAGDGADTQS